MFNKLEARVLSEYKRSRAAPSTFCTLIKHYFAFIKHYIKHSYSFIKHYKNILWQYFMLLQNIFGYIRAKNYVKINIFKKDFQSVARVLCL
jgi:hypothetical protein